MQADLDNMVGITSYRKQEYENGESKKQINKKVSDAVVASFKINCS